MGSIPRFGQDGFVRRTPLWTNAGCGLLAVGAGVAASELVTGLLSLKMSPTVALGEAIIKLTPGPVVEWFISHVGRNDKPLLITGIFVGLAVCGALIGLLAAHNRTAAYLALATLGGIGLWAERFQHGSTIIDAAPAIVAPLVAIPVLSWLLNARPVDATVGAERNPDLPVQAADSFSRRTLLMRGVLVVGASLVVAAGGRILSRTRAAVESARRNLKLPLVRTRVPPGVSVGVPGVSDWVTPVDDFYRIDTSLSPPLIEPNNWQLRIRGMVDREITLTYQDLLQRGLTDAWITLNCVSNPVGGPLIGNAHWSGVRIADLLAEAGVQSGADAVLSTSKDGWNCGTPIEVLTDDRNALLAVAMDGQPLPIEHGFPVRMLVPGLYGFVSATKWVVDLNVTRFADFTAYWTARGWSPRAPVKTSSRIDVPSSGSSVNVGPVAIGGVAWAQHRGIDAVQVQVDSEAWMPVTLGAEPTIDTWVQWRYEWDAPEGDHTIAVRAIDGTGAVQSSQDVGVVPNGAEGYHTISVHVG
jgi:DMSO/TMAO reductase YedYZ molybdopterin-dependent catalytic subunit